MYAINLDSENRILRATTEEFADSESILVSGLPEGDITDYKYTDGEYTHEPLEKEEVLETPTEDAVPDTTAKDIAEIKEALQAHDAEIDTIINGLEAINNG